MAGRSESTVFKEGDGALCVGAPVQKVKKGWKWSKLRDLASMHSGHTPSRRHPEWWGGDIKWIRVADARPCHGGGIFETGETINENGLANSAAELLPPGTVCLSRSASIGYVVILEDEMCTNQGFANWICGEQLIPRFLQFLFLREQKFLDRIATGTAHRTIYYPDLKAFHILHPSRQEQERIVEVLDEAFAAIDKAKANIERNLTNARELFQSHLNEIFSDPPEDWEVNSLGELCDLQNGFAFKSKEYVENGVRILRNKNVSIGSLTEANWVCYPNESMGEYDRFLINEGDFVISMDRPIISDGFKFFGFQS